MVGGVELGRGGGRCRKWGEGRRAGWVLGGGAGRVGRLRALGCWECKS